MGEPWNYEGSDGPNEIIGVLLFIHADYAIFKSDGMLTFESIEGDLLLLQPRYISQTFIPHSRQIINGALLLTDDWQTLNLESLESNSKFVLIGDIEKIIN